jgi:hypothetical protein
VTLTDGQVQKLDLANQALNGVLGRLFMLHGSEEVRVLVLKAGELIDEVINSDGEGD